jgi:hypothetical protein
MNIHEYQTLLFKNDKFLFTVYEKGFFWLPSINIGNLVCYYHAGLPSPRDDQKDTFFPGFVS